MSLTAKDVAEILRLLEESSFDELELEAGDLKLSLRRGTDGVREAPPPALRATSPVARGRTKTAEPAHSSPPPPAGEVARSAGVGNSGLDGVEVPAPLLGVFYRAPKPGEAPFVEIGSKVEEDTVIGIIEVMKLMNSVRAGVRGEIVEIVAQNAALVEYGEALIRVRPAD
jgi:acetyl-CoA carboxylase biotin carboxyl carrier protein